MPIANLTRVLVVGTFVDPDGDPITGRITFAPSFDVLVDPDEHVIIDNTTLSAQLDADGSFAIQLPATNAPGTTPINWTYRVSEPTGRSYSITVDYQTPGGVLDLVDVIPSGIASPAVVLLARRIRDSQDYAEPAGPPVGGQVITWDQAVGRYRPATPTPPYGAEQARDDVGGSLRAGTALMLVVDDAADTITYAAAVGAAPGTLAAGNDARIVGAAQKSANLGDLGDSAASRANLGLGNSATRAVGTAAGTVAAGDDARVLGAAQKAANLSDLASASAARTALGLAAVAASGSASDIITGTLPDAVIPAGITRDTELSAAVAAVVGAAPAALDTLVEIATQLQADESAAATLTTVVGGKLAKASNLSDVADVPTSRTNLGLGNSATRAVGTTAGTVAAGDDGRIAGAAQKSANLSDLADAAAARTALALGNSATRAVGTTVGTVAAGDDARIAAAAGAAQKSANLSDLVSAIAARLNLGVYIFDAPNRHGLKEWNYPTDLIGSSAGNAGASGVIYGLRVDAQQSAPISTITLVTGTTAAAGLTAGQCVAVVIDNLGAEVARTGDLSGQFGAQNTVYNLALTAAFTPTLGVAYSVLLLLVGTTMPAFIRSSATSVTAPDVGQSGSGGGATSPRKYYTAGSGKTAIVTPLDMSTTGTGNAPQTWWVGLS